MNIKKNMLQHENYLSEFASKNKDAIRLNNIDEDIRGHYFRDIDRIIHSLSYTRYIDKTQVFSINDNDNISKRIIHVTLVSKIARTISRALNLNEDLTEAIALGHDLGHVPFGHVGEKFLNNLSQKYNNTYFLHNIQSVRTLMTLEKKNLTIQTLDGIMCHNGEFELQKYYPKKKTKEDFLKEYELCLQDMNIAEHLIPMTLEGCVVRISDMIGYLGRDIEDAVRLNLLNLNDIPKEITNILGKNNKEIVNTIILDIIENSFNKNYILLSDKVYNAIKQLKKFNYENIYNKANSKERLIEIENMFNIVFDKSLNDLNNKNTDSNIYKYFLNNMDKEYISNTPNPKIVIDYIAGMTDDYFINEYNTICNK